MRLRLPPFLVIPLLLTLSLAPAGGQTGGSDEADFGPLAAGLVSSVELAENPGLAPGGPYTPSVPAFRPVEDGLPFLCGKSSGPFVRALGVELNGLAATTNVVAEVKDAESTIGKIRRNVRACTKPYTGGEFTFTPIDAPPLNDKNAVAFAAKLEDSSNNLLQIAVAREPNLIGYMLVLAPSEAFRLSPRNARSLVNLLSRHLEAVDRAANPPEPRALSTKQLARQDYEGALPSGEELGLPDPVTTEPVSASVLVRGDAVASTLCGKDLPLLDSIVGAALSEANGDPTQLTQLLAGYPGDEAAAVLEAASKAIESCTEPFVDASGATVTPVEPPDAIVAALPEDTVVFAGTVEKEGEPPSTVVQVLHQEGQFVTSIATTGELAPVVTPTAVYAAAVLDARTTAGRNDGASGGNGQATATYTGTGTFNVCFGPSGACQHAVRTQYPQVTLQIEGDRSATLTFTVIDTNATVDSSCTSVVTSGTDEVALTGTVKSLGGGIGTISGQFSGAVTDEVVIGSHVLNSAFAGSCQWSIEASLSFSLFA